MSSKDKEVAASGASGGETIKFPDKGNGKSSKKKNGKKSRMSFGFFIGVIVLIVVSIMFIIPATAFGNNRTRIVFGKYDGIPIALEQNNFFYNQLNSIFNMYAQQFGGMVPDALVSSIYYQAFQQTAMYTAVSDLAKNAKFQPTKEEIDQAVIENGYWDDSDGNFDADRYSSATKTEKNMVNDYYELIVPYMTVLDDAQGAKVSDGETSFIRSLSSDTKSFEYIIVDETSLPREKVEDYFNANPAPLMEVELTPIYFATEEEAKSAYDTAVSGDFSSAEASSLAPSEERHSTPYMLYELEDMIGTEGAESIFSSSEGDVFGPYSVDELWYVYRLDGGPMAPDLANEEDQSKVREYLKSHDSEALNTYLEEISNTLYADALSDFDKAAEDNSLETATVMNVSENPGSSSFVYSLSMADVSGYLSSKASDDDFSASLFDMENGDVMKPVSSSGAYIIVRATESTGPSPLLNTILSTYGDYTGSMSTSDFQDSVMSSSLLEDNFSKAYSKYVSAGE